MCYENKLNYVAMRKKSGIENQFRDVAKITLTSSIHSKWW